MPGETYQTLKEKATKQAKQSGMSQTAADNYGSAMASQAAQVGGAANPDPSGGGTYDPEFFGNADNNYGDISEAMSGSTAAPLEQIAARKEAEKKKQEAGGVFNPQTGMVEYPQQTNIFGGLGSLDLNDIINKSPFLLTKAMAGGAKGLQFLLDKTFKPQISDFSNPNFLAVLDAAFKSGKLNEESWKETYGGLLDDVYSGQAKEDLEAGLGSRDSKDLFDLAMEEATANVEPGSGTQRITNPEGFYLDDGQGILPQTSGGLTDLAGLDVNQFTSGPGYNQTMVDMIFAARAELDRMNKDSSGNTQGGIMAASSTPPGIPVVPPTTPVVPPTTPVVSPVVAQTTTPFDLSQFYAGLPTFNQSPYARQGLGSYNEILRRYYG
jgi:hypothetical protein